MSNIKYTTGQLIPVWKYDRLPRSIKHYWIPCNGMKVDKKTYPKLVETLGTTFSKLGELECRLPNAQGLFICVQSFCWVEPAPETCPHCGKPVEGRCALDGTRYFNCTNKSCTLHLCPPLPETVWELLKRGHTAKIELEKAAKFLNSIHSELNDGTLDVTRLIVELTNVQIECEHLNAVLKEIDE